MISLSLRPVILLIVMFDHGNDGNNDGGGGDVDGNGYCKGVMAIFLMISNSVFIKQHFCTLHVFGFSTLCMLSQSLCS